ncbi:MAG: thioesterase family protein [Mastigocoleus sp. MO_167.B18]|uniref:acyl-CoA thioesterase n=1 Tax=Mastigocoleus sp. MO_188.B34 TaxID=3036635 RepID=UPI002607F9C4|nr:thioesterase family protein [Mastigocoleus sp. MO_188.B34]MDJ0695754.1 thioesterase family protein [Mastigocoleus sp. MO_188.B34]MDJ0774609.1 thioesterase family protein [Mastigocoleus sp. MO_167.B18]
MGFTYSYNVRFRDTDAAGVVYFANILNICHEAYESSLVDSDIDIKEFFTKPILAFPIVHADVDFFRPIFCGDRLEIKMIAKKLGNDKFEINYEIFAQNILASKANTRHVCIHGKTRKRADLPGYIISWLDNLG